MMPSPGEFVRVLYKGRHVFNGERDPRTSKELSGGWEVDASSPFTIMWDSREYPLTPGKETFVPFEAAMLAFGDPRASEHIVSSRDQHGRVGFVADRATEVRRLRTKYDNMYGDETVVEHHPLAEVYDMDGQRVVTVLDDPVGATVNPARQTQQEQGELLEVVRRQQDTINRLMERVGFSPESPAPPSPAFGNTDEDIEMNDPDVPEMYRDVPPQDDSRPMSEALTGERGGVPTGDPPMDFSTLNAE